MLKKMMLTALCSLVLFQTFAQALKTIETSIAVEYAYEGVNSDDVVGQMMFAKKRFLVYTDANYLYIKSYSADPTPKTMDGIVIGVIKDLKTGDVYPCLTIGDQKLRQKEAAEDKLSDQIFTGFTGSTISLSKTGTLDYLIDGFSCEKWMVVESEMEDTSMVYIAPTLMPNDGIKDQPLFVQHGGQYLGLLVGKDTPFGPKVYRFRAQKIVVDKPMDIAAELAKFKEVEKEALNTAFKNYLGL